MNILKRLVCLFKGHVLTTPSITMAIGENNWLKKCDRCGYYVLHADAGGVTVSEKYALDFKRRFEAEMKRYEKELKALGMERHEV